MCDAERKDREFFARPTLAVARELLGKTLVRIEECGSRTAGVIVETEAYAGGEDLGCHGRSGRTRRNASMWGPPGHAYVYFTYGMHWLLNLVTEAEGTPSAVLLRAIVPTEGLPAIRSRRPGRRLRELANGPAKLCRALALDGSHDGLDLCAERSSLVVEEGLEIPEGWIRKGPRVGLNSVPEPWKSIPWRFLVDPRRWDAVATTAPRRASLP